MDVSVIKPLSEQNYPFYMHRCEERIRENRFPHAHDCIEINYVCSGSGYHLIEDKEYEVFKGDLFILNSGVTHTFYRDSTSKPLINYIIDFNLDFLDYQLIDASGFGHFANSYLFDSLESPPAVEHIRLNAEQQADFDRLFDGMHHEYTMKKNGYMSIIRARMIELIVKLIRVVSDDGQHKKKRANAEFAITAAIGHIHEHFLQGVSLNELSLRFFLSKPHFCKMFKEYTGMTLSEYVQNLRINESCRLLETTDMKVVDIGLESGFSDYKSFKNTFRKVKGMLPSEYRESR